MDEILHGYSEEIDEKANDEELSDLYDSLVSLPTIELENRVPEQKLAQLVAHYSVNTVQELRSQCVLLSKQYSVPEHDVIVGFQTYLNTRAKGYYTKGPIYLQELFFNITGDQAMILKNNTSLLQQDGDIGSQTLQLLDNMRVCLFLDTKEESVFDRDAKEIFGKESGFQCLYITGNITSTSDLHALLKRKKIYVPELTIQDFQLFLNTEAKKYGLTAIPVTGTWNTTDVRLAQQLRAAHAVHKLDDNRSDDAWRWKHLWLDTEVSGVDDDDLQRDLLDKRVTNADLVKTLTGLNERIASGVFRQQGAAYLDKIQGRVGEVVSAWGVLQLAETTGIGITRATNNFNRAKRILREGLLEDPLLNDWVKGTYMTYCVRSMRENFDKVGVDVSRDYPLCTEGDPAFRRDVLGPIRGGEYSLQMLRQDAQKQIDYFQDKPEYFQGFSLRAIPANKIDAYCYYLENFLYDTFHDDTRNYDSHGVVCPLLHDRTPLGHASICYLNDDDEIMVADSYYMPDGRSGPFREYIKSVRQRMQSGTGTEGVILLPRFAYQARQ